MAMRTVCLSNILRAGALASQNVHPLRNRLKMIRIYTGRHATQMIDLKSIGNRPYVHLISKPMRRHHAFAIPEHAITHRACNGIGPKPTTRVWLRHILFFKPFEQDCVQTTTSL